MYNAVYEMPDPDEILSDILFWMVCIYVILVYLYVLIHRNICSIDAMWTEYMKRI